MENNTEFNGLDTLGRKLREIRESKNMSLSKVSEEIHITTATLSRLENNKVSPNIRTILKLMKYYNVSIDDLI